MRLLQRQMPHPVAAGCNALDIAADIGPGHLPGVPRAQTQLLLLSQVAFQQSDYVAWNLWAAINRRPLLPFKYQHLGEAMSLGEHTCPAVNGNHLSCSDHAFSFKMS